LLADQSGQQIRPPLGRAESYLSVFSLD
jgi:hypothetical protein